MSLAFLILALLTVAGTVAAMTLRGLVHCALALTIAFGGLAALYLELGAQFAGLVQVLVYVGAVLILIVFAILLTRSHEPPLSSVPGAHDGKSLVSGSVLGGLLVAAAVFGVLVWAIAAQVPAQGAILSPAPGFASGSMEQIGQALMGRFVLPLEVVGLLLTAALIGAVVIAMEEKRSVK